MGPIFESTWRDIVSEKRTKPQNRRKKKKTDGGEKDGYEESDSEDGGEASPTSIAPIDSEQQSTQQISDGIVKKTLGLYK
jgi:hypothetical protein